MAQSNGWKQRKLQSYFSGRSWGMAFSSLQVQIPPTKHKDFRYSSDPLRASCIALPGLTSCLLN